MNKKYSVRLSHDEVVRIYEVLNAKKTSKTVRSRCQVLLLLDENTGKALGHGEISQKTKVCLRAIGVTAKTYATEGLEYTLRPRRHEKPPVKPIVTGEIEARIIALACSKPPEGYSRWSLRLLTKRVIELEIVESIGRETVRRTLKKINSSHT
jgi:hypothetical protein